MEINDGSTSEASSPPSAFYSMGLSTYRVPLSLYATNRVKLINAFLKSNPTAAENSHQLVYIEGGKSTTRFDSDHEPIFRQESYFHYLFGVREPDCAAVLNIQTGQTVLFIPKLPSSYATFMGSICSPNDFRTRYGVDQVLFTQETESHLRSYKDCTLFLLHGENTDSGKMYATPNLPDSIASFHTIDTKTLFPILSDCRVTKSPSELKLLRHVTEITSLAHAYTMKNTHSGMMEYQSESLFKHFCYYNFGARNVGYTSICGCGPNGAVLHYGHAGAPNDRAIKEGDMCLFDMGAEYCCYGSDVTCSFPVSGKFTERQKCVYEGVLNAQRKVLKMIRPGVSWVDCHKAAECEILKALVHLGVVLCPEGLHVEDLVEKRLGAVFMPHGLGHLIGIDTHDVGGYIPGRTPNRIQLPGLERLRTARILEKNMTLTVEPGCYFIDHLLDEALEEGSGLKEYFNVDILTNFRGFGGVRLEDVVVVMEDGCENYTICPRTVEEVEYVKNGGKWPPLKDLALELKRTRLTDTKPLDDFVSQSVVTMT